MKVGVLSLGQSMGKTHFISVLSGVFSRSQQRSVAILSTGSAVDNIEIVDVKVRDDDVGNALIFRSMLNAAEKGDKSLFDYGLRQGDENVFIFDVLNNSMEDYAKHEFFLECMDKLPADLIMIEIVGDYKDPWNQEVLKNCDCYFALIDTSKKGLRLAANYRANETPSIVRRTAFVLSRYNPVTIGEKKIHKTTNIPQAVLFQWPYNVQISKMGYDGVLNNAAYDMINGSGTTLIPLREKMQECMQFMFDSPARKIIRDIDRWSK